MEDMQPSTGALLAHILAGRDWGYGLEILSGNKGGTKA